MIKESSIYQLSDNLWNTFQHYKQRWNAVNATLKTYDVATGQDIEETIKELNTSKQRIVTICTDKINAAQDLINYYLNEYQERDENTYKKVLDLESECKLVLKMFEEDK